MKLAIAAAVLLLAQTPQPRFEVASVKAHTGGGGTTRRIEPQTLTYLNVPLNELITMAYDIRRYQIVAPDWVVNIATRDRFDVVAKAAAPASNRDLRAMIGPLLHERFHLEFHRETRVLPVYLLVVDKGGPKFKEGDGGEASAGPDPGGGVHYTNQPMAALAGFLSVLPATGRPVLDRTGLTGRYTFTANLQELPAGLSAADQKSTELRSDTPAFTALQDQLGLKLVPDRAPIEMLVVDGVDRVPVSD